MAIEILESMDESVVALKAARLLRRAKDKAVGRSETNNATTFSGNSANGFLAEQESGGPIFTHEQTQSAQPNHYWGSFGLIEENGIDFDMANQLGGFDQNNPMFLFLGIE